MHTIFLKPVDLLLLLKYCIFGFLFLGLLFRLSLSLSLCCCRKEANLINIFVYILQNAQFVHARIEICT